MIARVPHLVTVEAAAADETAAQNLRSQATRQARRAAEGRQIVMKLHDLRPPAGSNRPRRRVGRGIGGKGGKTAGRGTKGQHARNTVAPGFEGGQLPLAQRIPKLKGFHNPFRVAYAVVNLDSLETFAGEVVIAGDPGGRGPRPQRCPGQGAGPG